jgi:agmatine deiminase
MRARSTAPIPPDLASGTERVKSVPVGTGESMPTPRPRAVCSTTDVAESESPSELGFRMPAEWEPHAATWLSWPHKEESWPGNFEPIPGVFAEMVEALVPGEQVRILAGTEELEASARAALRARGVDGHPNVRFHRVPTNDSWARDHGPIFLVGKGGEVAIADFGYNAWGGKYPPWDLDERVPARVAEILGLRRFVGGMILEGGSIDVDGRGTLLTTESCLLNPNRNPRLSREDIEDRLRRFLGVRKILWLGDGIVGDDTDGHVDDLTRFVAPATIVTVVEEDPEDANHEPLRRNLERLKTMTDAEGRALEIAELPMPPPLHYEGTRLPASYANFYVGNAAVLVPVFDHPRDRIACDTLARFFPGRTITPIRATELVWGLGAFHCVTQQQPAPTR